MIALNRWNHRAKRCSHGPVARAGVGTATHPPGSSGPGTDPAREGGLVSVLNRSWIRRLPPHGSATHGYNASRHTASFLRVLILVLLLASLCRAAPVTTTLVPALGWDVNKQGGFPVSLASDPSGNIWVGTEGNGLWKYDAATKAWTQFTTNDGLGDDCVYALAFDQQNRLWAGHLNHGVSVYNCDKWRNYGLLDGPIGDHVFAIAVSPKDVSLGQTVTVSDKTGASTYWWLATLASLEGDLGGTPPPPPDVTVNFNKLVGAAVNNITVTPASYNGSIFTPPAISGTFTVPSFLSPGKHGAIVNYIAPLEGINLQISAKKGIVVS